MFTLVLSDTYEFVNFVPFRKLLNYIVNQKVDILSYWDNKILDLNNLGKIQYPAVLRLKRPIPRHYKEQKFSRNRMYRRDHYLCQYCGEALTNKNVTTDHVLPKSRGGPESWTNCVTACWECNNFKGDRTPEEAGMKLKREPAAPPRAYNLFDFFKMEKKHPDWSYYLGLD